MSKRKPGSTSLTAGNRKSQIANSNPSPQSPPSSPFKPESSVARQDKVDQAMADIGRLVQWNAPIRRLASLHTVAEAVVEKIRAHIDFEQARVIALAEGIRTGQFSTLPAARPWDDAFAKVNAMAYDKLTGTGATDAELKRLVAVAADRGTELGHYRLMIGGNPDDQEPYLSYIIDPGFVITSGDALIADIRRVLKISYPPEKKAPASRKSQISNPKSETNSKVQNPKVPNKAKSGAGGRTNNKAAEVDAALAKANAKKGSGFRGQGSGAKAKPATAAAEKLPILTLKEGQYKLAFRRDGHTRYKLAPHRFSSTPMGRDDAIEWLLDASGLGVKAAVKDNTGIPQAAPSSASGQAAPASLTSAPSTQHSAPSSGTPGNGLPRIYQNEDRWYVEDATGKITGLRKAVTEADAWREGSLALSSGHWPDQYGPIHGPDGKQGSASANCPAKSTKSAATTPGVTTPVVPDDAFDHLPDGYYLGVAVGQWVLYHCVDGGRERFEITDDFNAVEDAIREACKQHSLDPKDITVLDEDGLMPLPGTGADLLKAEAEAATEA